MKKKGPLRKKKSQHSFIIYSQLAFQMLVVIAGGILIGYKLDQIYSNSYSLFTILFSIISVTLSVYYLISQVTKDD